MTREGRTRAMLAITEQAQIRKLHEQIDQMAKHQAATEEQLDASERARNTFAVSACVLAILCVCLFLGIIAMSGRVCQ